MDGEGAAGSGPFLILRVQTWVMIVIEVVMILALWRWW
jgi:hypothetical protein